MWIADWWWWLAMLIAFCQMAFAVGYYAAHPRDWPQLPSTVVLLVHLQFAFMNVWTIASVGWRAWLVCAVVSFVGSSYMHRAGIRAATSERLRLETILSIANSEGYTRAIVDSATSKPAVR